MKKLLTARTSIIFFLLLIIFPCFYVGLLPAFIWAIVLTYCVHFITKSLYQKLPSPNRLNFSSFNIHLLLILFCLFVLIFIIQTDLDIDPRNSQLVSWALPVMALLQVIAGYCMLYVIWFIAKSLATIENHKTVPFNAYAGTFILLLIFPIGIWWIYPRIRKIFS